MGISFPPFNLSYLIIAGYAFLIGIIHNSTNFKQVFFRGYTVFLFFELIALSWIALSGFRENADSFLILGGSLTILIHCILYQIPVIVYFFIYKGFNHRNKNKTGDYNGQIKLNKNNYSLFVFPFVFTSFEYIMSVTEVSFPWLTTGNAFTTNLEKIQYAEITGVYGISVWSLYLSSLLYYLFFLIRNPDININSIIRHKHIIIALLIIVFFVSPNLYTHISQVKNIHSKSVSNNIVRIAIVQPNVDPWKKWGTKSSELVKSYVESIKNIAGKDSSVKLIVFPETAITFYLLHPAFKERFFPLKNIVDSIGIPVIIGFPDMEIHKDLTRVRIDSKPLSTGGYYDIFNTAVLLEKGKDDTSYQKYHKNKLVAGSERMPYQEKVSFLKSLISWGVGISSYQIGTDTTIFNVDNKYKFNTAICYESVYPEFFSSFVKKGAEFSVIITNDGWWGKLPGTYQHNMFAVLRAIENRRWIIRCANTGISGVIDSYGNMYEQSNINEEALIITTIGTNNKITFYSDNGDYVGRFSVYLTLATFTFLIILAVFRYKKKN